MREQTGTGSTAGNRPLRCASLNDAVTGRTGEFRANMADLPGVNYFGRLTSIILAGGSEAWLV